jgi:hypothetical protein
MDTTTLAKPCQGCDELKEGICTNDGGHCESATISTISDGGKLPPMQTQLVENAEPTPTTPAETPPKDHTEKLEERITALEERLEAAGIQ